MAGGSHNLEEPDLDSLRSRIASVFDASLERVRREQKELAAEQSAFEEFRDRVDSIDPTPLQVGPLSVNKRITRKKPIERVQTAYTETVLSVPHFEREYSESYIENIRAEFNVELASALDPDNPAQLTPLLKRTIIQAANQCIAARAALLEDIDRELESLRCSQTELVNILEEIDTAQAIARSESTFTDRLESVARARQQVIHRHYSLQSLDGHHLHEYLYSKKPWDYPVLLVVGRFRDIGIQ